VLVKATDWSENISKQVDQIFYETSVRTEFKDEKERLAFKFKYLDFYLENYPEYSFAYLDSGRVLGYIVAATETNEQLQHSSYYQSFEKCLSNYPAHLHINCSSISQGKGVGSLLWTHLKQKLVKDKIKGLHIITTPDARNIGFYTKNDFDYRYDVKTDSYHLTLLGISLS
jgi:ribosomal protein S18 acetylase RimI-like enzyme